MGLFRKSRNLTLPTVANTELKGWTYFVKGVLKSPNYGIFGIRSNGHRDSVCPARTNVTGQVSKYGNNHDKYGRY